MNDGARQKVRDTLAALRLEYAPAMAGDEGLLRSLAKMVLAQDVTDEAWLQAGGYDWCVSVAREFLIKGFPVPPPLDDFVVRVLDGELTRPQRGPRCYLYDYRNAVIVLAVHSAVQAGLAPTRNDASNATSACDLVAECLQELGHDLGYKAVEKIWTNRPPLQLPPG